MPLSGYSFCRAECGKYFVLARKLNPSPHWWGLLGSGSAGLSLWSVTRLHCKQCSLYCSCVGNISCENSCCSLQISVHCSPIQLFCNLQAGITKKLASLAAALGSTHRQKMENPLTFYWDPGEMHITNGSTALHCWDITFIPFYCQYQYRPTAFYLFIPYTTIVLGHYWDTTRVSCL